MSPICLPCAFTHRHCLLILLLSLPATVLSAAETEPASATTSVRADSLRIPISQQGQNQQALPKRGMKMAAVEQAFGTPERREGPIGKPPITRWFYPEFKVTFEGETVIASVINFVAKLPIENRTPDEPPVQDATENLN